MAIPWTFKKQFTIFLIIVAVITVIVFSVLSFANQPTCIDGKKNQAEENIDCGGPCEPCVGEVKNLIIHWSKAFKLKDGKYEAASLVENPNLFAGLSSVKYKFNIYDNKNILIVVKSGETFVNPDERLLIFEDNLDTGERTPKYVFLEIENNLNWKRIEKEKPQLVVSQKQFINSEPFPKLVIGISNKSFMAVSNISLAAILYDEKKNAKSISVSKLESILGDSEKQVILTWPEIFLEEPDSIEILIRSNFTK